MAAASLLIPFKRAGRGGPDADQASRGNLHGPTKALESLVIVGFMRGLSVRDVESALAEQAALSKSTVSRICQILVDQFEVWQRRGLAEYELDYLFADASFFKYPLRPGASPSSAPGGSPQWASSVTAAR